MPFDPHDDYDRYVDGQPRADGVRGFLRVPGHRPARGRPRRPARRAETVNGLGQPQERHRAAPDPRGRRRGLRGLGALPARRAGGRAADGGRLVEREHARGAAGHRPRRPLRRPRRRPGGPRAQACPASRRPTRSSPAPPSSASDPGARRRSSRTRSPASRPAAPGDFGIVVGVDRVGQADALREHGADVVVQRPGRAARRPRRERMTTGGLSLPTDAPPHPADRLRGRAVGGARERPRHRRARPRRVGVRALERARRPARQPRRGRAARAARHVPQLGLRVPPAAVRRGRLRLPRVRARRSSTSPTARSSGCSSTTSRSTSATARCSSTSGCSTCAPASSTGDVTWRSPAGRAVRIRTTRLVSFTHRSIVADRLRGRGARRRRPDRAAVRARRQRGAARRRHGPAHGRGARPPLEPMEHDAAGLRLQLLHRTRRSGIGVAVAADHVIEGPRARTCRPRRRSARTGAGSPSRRRCGPARRCGWSSS